jgi:hypothetical protein
MHALLYAKGMQFCGGMPIVDLTYWYDFVEAYLSFAAWRSVWVISGHMIAGAALNINTLT